MAKKKTVKNGIDNSEFFEALRLMEEEKGIPQKYIAEKFAEAIVVAARKDYGGNEIVSCVIDPEKQIFTVTARKEVVDVVEDSFTQISREDAAAIDPNSVELGFVEISLDPRKFGRVVAQNSKNNFR
ncbi:MAG: transcription termination/antitermination protein NusA, partial [Clostridia bacterium]|nr:transcription termination/antitermination protein NusA [Clostridia bacterium]